MLNPESPDAPATSDTLVESLLALDVSGDPGPEDTPADAPAEPAADPAIEAQDPAVVEASAPAEVTTEPIAEAAASPDAPTDAPPAQSPAPEPFRLTVDGTTVDVPGATVAGDTITIPRDAFQRVLQPRLADRREWQRKEQGYQQQIKQATERVTTEAAQSKAALDKLAAILDEPDDIKRWEAVEDLRAKLPVLIRDAKIAALESRDTQASTREQEEQRAKHLADLQAAMPANVADHLDHFLAKPEYGALKSERQRVLDHLLDNTDKLYLPNGEPDPTTGIPPLAFNVDYVTRLLGREAKYAADRAAEFKKVQDAAKANASTARRPAPPSAPATGTPTGTVKAVPIKTKAEFDQYLDNLANDAA